MKTRQDEPLYYVELARQGARIERSLTGDDLLRWSQLVDGEWHVQANLEFYRDTEGQSWVKVDYESRASMLCTRCSEVLSHTFAGQVAMCIVNGEAQASELAGDCDVLVVQGDVVLLADIIEDELLLAVPEQLCVADECEHMLPLYYPAPGGAQLEQSEQPEQTERKNPFDVLAALKQ
jgi:uncharacterized protein